MEPILKLRNIDREESFEGPCQRPTSTAISEALHSPSAPMPIEISQQIDQLKSPIGKRRGSALERFSKIPTPPAAEVRAAKPCRPTENRMGSSAGAAP